VAFAAIVFWFVAFVTASLPVALTYLVARLLRIRSIFYYLLCGAVTGAALAPIFVWFDWHDDAAAFLRNGCGMRRCLPPSAPAPRRRFGIRPAGTLTFEQRFEP
jgi:hypothetical protein